MSVCINFIKFLCCCEDKLNDSQEENPNDPQKDIDPRPFDDYHLFDDVTIEDHRMNDDHHQRWKISNELTAYNIYRKQMPSNFLNLLNKEISKSKGGKFYISWEKQSESSIEDIACEALLEAGGKAPFIGAQVGLKHQNQKKVNGNTENVALKILFVKGEQGLQNLNALANKVEVDPDGLESLHKVEKEAENLFKLLEKQNFFNWDRIQQEEFLFEKYPKEWKTLIDGVNDFYKKFGSFFVYKKSKYGYLEAYFQTQENVNKKDKLNKLQIQGKLVNNIAELSAEIRQQSRQENMEIKGEITLVPNNLIPLRISKTFEKIIVDLNKTFSDQALQEEVWDKIEKEGESCPTAVLSLGHPVIVDTLKKEYGIHYALHFIEIAKNNLLRANRRIAFFEKYKGNMQFKFQIKHLRDSNLLINEYGKLGIGEAGEKLTIEYLLNNVILNIKRYLNTEEVFHPVQFTQSIEWSKKLILALTSNHPFPWKIETGEKLEMDIAVQSYIPEFDQQNKHARIEYKGDGIYLSLPTYDPEALNTYLEKLKKDRSKAKKFTIKVIRNGPLYFKWISNGAEEIDYAPSAPQSAMKGEEN